MTPEQAQKIYDQIDTYVIELDPNPAARGTEYLMGIISKTRGFLNAAGVLRSKLSRQKHMLTMQLSELQTAYDIGAQNLLVSDNRVSRLPAIEDRRAMIAMLQRDEYQKIEKIKHTIADVDFVEKAVKMRHQELQETMSAIRLQRSLLQVEVEAGGQYGDETGEGRGKVGVPDEDELSVIFDENILKGVEGEGKSEEPEKPPPAKKVELAEPELAEGSSRDDGIDVDSLLSDETGDEGEGEGPGEEPVEEEDGREGEGEGPVEEEEAQDDGEGGGEGHNTGDTEDDDVDAFLDGEGEDYSDLFEDL